MRIRVRGSIHPTSNGCAHLWVPTPGGGRQRLLNPSAGDRGSPRPSLTASAPRAGEQLAQRGRYTPRTPARGHRAHTGQRRNPTRMRTPLRRPQGPRRRAGSGYPDFRSTPRVSGSGFLGGREGPSRPGSRAMEKLRRVLSGQDDEEQNLTAQVGSLPPASGVNVCWGGAAERGQRAASTCRGDAGGRHGPPGKNLGRFPGFHVVYRSSH